MELMTIIGDGIMAYILHKMFPVNTKVIGMGENGVVKLPPIFHIHSSDSTKYMLEKMGICFVEKEIVVGFINENGFKDKPDENDEKIYRYKTFKHSSKRVLNGNKTRYKALEIVGELKFDEEIYECGEVYRIDGNKTKYFTEYGMSPKIHIENGSIVSTVRLDETLMWLGIESKLPSVHKCWVYDEIVDDFMKKECTYDYVYDVSKCSHYNRHIFVDGRWISEVTYDGEFPPVADPIYTMENSQITKNVGIDRIGNIHLFGRYARWDNGVLIHSEIERAMNGI